MRWLEWLFGKRDEAVYYPRDREIYSYFDGQSVRRADPVALYKKVMEKGPELSIDIKLSNSIHKDAGKGQENALVKIRDIFGLKSFEEGGLTEWEAAELLDNFLEYCETLKKNSSPSAMSSNSSEGSPTTSEAVPPTSSSSASGLTANGCSTAAPTPSSLASASPSGPSSPT